MNNLQHKEFWEQIIRNPDGSLNEEQIFKELEDFKDLIHRHVTVVCELTGNTLSKATYPAETIISVANDHFTNQLEHEMKMMIEDAKNLDIIDDKQMEQILELI